jgi:thioredoxin-related protein
MNMKTAWVSFAVAMSLPLCTAAALWTDDYEKAQEQAKAEGKAMLLNFTGSDWCGWCKRLDAEVFSKKEFKAYADEHLVCVKLDFPRGFNLPSGTVKQNEELSAKFAVQGYPTIILLNPNGKKIAETGYRQGGVDAYVEHLKAFIEPHASKWKPSAPAKAAPEAAPREQRTWSSRSGSTIDATFEKMVGAQAVLRKSDGSAVKIGLDALSDADREYLKSIRAY